MHSTSNCLLMIIWNVVTKVKTLVCADDHLSSPGPEVYNVYKFASMSHCIALVMLRVSVDFDHHLCFTVEQLLQETNLTVCVFTGQLDLIVDTPGELVSSLTGQVIHYSNSTCLWSSWPSIAFFSTYSHLPKTKIL